MQKKIVGASYFVVIRLLQANAVAELEEKLHYNQSQRTDISFNSNWGQPNFIKNKMHFHGIDTSGKSWTTLDFIVYMAPSNLQPEQQAAMDSQTLMKQSLLVAQGQHKVTLQELMGMKKRQEDAQENNEPDSDKGLQKIELFKLGAKHDYGGAQSNASNDGE